MNALKKEIQWAIENINELKSEHNASHLVYAFPLVKAERGFEDPSPFFAAAVAEARQTAGHRRKRSITVEVKGVQDLSIRLSSKERMILNSLDCLTLYRKRGRVFCAIPWQVVDSVTYGTVGIVAVPPYGSKWNLSVVLAIDETSRKLSERLSNEFKSDINAAAAYRLSRNALPIFRMVLQEMNRCWREPICKCSDRISSDRCEQCGRPYERPDETVATSIVAYEIGVRCAEQCLKSLLLLDNAELRQLPFEKQEVRLRRWGHGLDELWNQLQPDIQSRIHAMVVKGGAMKDHRGGGKVYHQAVVA